MKRLAVIVGVLALTATACGSGDDAAGAAPTATSTTSAPTTTTTAATTTAATATPGIPAQPVDPGADADVDAIVEAFVVVFDSSTTYEEKAPYLVDRTGLEETVTKYLATGDEFGGVAVAVTAVGTDGDIARVVYDLLFAGNPTYTEVEGDAVRTGEGWQISREMFCGFMASARVGCTTG